MKKTHALVVFLIASFSAVGQFNLSCEFLTYAEGGIVADHPMDGRIVVTNEGPDIASGDTIVVGYIVSGTPNSLELEEGSYTIYETEEVFVSGTSVTIGSAELEWPAIGGEVELCAAAFGVGLPSVPDFTGDTDSTDNTSCITYVIPDLMGNNEIRNSNLNLSRIYTTPSQLIIVNDGLSSSLSASLSIFNMNGQVIQTENIVLSSGITMIELNNLKTGIYMVTINTQEGLITRKISFE
jgi:hypothetical protein